MDSPAIIRHEIYIVGDAMAMDNREKWMANDEQTYHRRKQQREGK
jgi:hypothetical protein